jgi:hypothetical protein
MTTTWCVFLPALLGALASSQSPDPVTQDPEQQIRIDRLRAAGVGVPFALYPIRVLGRADATVAEALGLVLERHGMPALEVAAVGFDPRDLAWDAVPAAFGAHVRAHAGGAAAGGHALYAEFLGDPRSGPTEVRFVVVDAAGALVIADRQTPVDATFRRTAGADPDPLGCAACVAERLFEVAGWKKVSGGVRDGRFAAMWERKSGMPDRKERAAMNERAAALRKSLADATFAVFAPAGAGDAAAAAASFAAAVQRALACKSVTAVATALVVPPAQNQQKRLYDLAGALRASVRNRPIAAAHAIAVEMGFADDGSAGFCNVVVVNRAGELVLAEFQNDQHALWQRLLPRTPADGERLAAAMLAKALR